MARQLWRKTTLIPMDDEGKVVLRILNRQGQARNRRRRSVVTAHGINGNHQGSGHEIRSIPVAAFAGRLQGGVKHANRWVMIDPFPSAASARRKGTGPHSALNSQIQRLASAEMDQSPGPNAQTKYGRGR